MRRHARILLFAGVAAVLLVATYLAQDLPSERRIDVRVHDRSIDRVELSWLDGAELIHRTELSAPFGSQRSTVSLRDGPYRLQLRVHRDGEHTDEERRIEVVDGAEQITIDVP